MLCNQLTEVFFEEHGHLIHCVDGILDLGGILGAVPECMHSASRDRNEHFFRPGTAANLLQV